MKKDLFYVIPLLCLVQTFSASAQDWHLTANSDATATSLLGTTNFIPLRLATNNVTRITITSAGKVGINHANPLNVLTMKLASASVPVSSWYKASTLIAGFGEIADGNSEMIIGMASSTPAHRSALYGKRARGTLAVPSAVAGGDQVFSLLGSGYSGTAFTDAASIDFIVDGSVSATSVPERIVFATGTSVTNRTERLRISSAGNFTFNTTQLFLQQSSGALAMGTTSPAGSSIMDIRSVAKGVLFPRMTQAQRDAIVSPATGLLIFQTNNSPGFYYFNSGWKELHSSVFNNGLTVTNGGLIAQGVTDGVAVTGNGDGQESIGIQGNAATGVVGNGIAGVIGLGLSGVSGSGVLGVEGRSEAGGFCGVCGSSADSYGVFGSSAAGYAGYFEGDVFSTGSFTTSDSKMKKNISDFDISAVELISKLQPKKYEYSNDANLKELNLPSGLQYGIMAEELEQILPSLVRDTKFEPNRPKTSFPVKGMKNIPQTIIDSSERKLNVIHFKAVNYTGLIPVLVKALQEVNEKVAKLEEQNQLLIEIIKKLDAEAGNSLPNSKSWMKQNIPNPFYGNTVIEYFVPSENKNARIVMTNSKGQILKYWNLGNGQGTLTIPRGTLAAGSYSYGLIIDGITISTKKMIIAR